MGLLIDGKWHDRWYDTDNNQGEFKREQSQFRGQIGSDEFPAEADRYHLYVSLACPWAHRALIFRRLKKLESLISVSVVSPIMLEHGWTFDVDQGSSGDPLHNAKYLHELYTRNQHDYSGRVTVPVLWDKKQQRIVNNESADIIRQFNGAFADLAEKTPDYYPESLQADIDAINDEIYNKVNNGVYRCGFATTQQAYEDAYDALFSALDTIENQLGTQRFLCGDTISEADWRLFTTRNDKRRKKKYIAPKKL